MSFFDEIIIFQSDVSMHTYFTNSLGFRFYTELFDVVWKYQYLISFMIFTKAYIFLCFLCFQRALTACVEISFFWLINFCFVKISINWCNWWQITIHWKSVIFSSFWCFTRWNRFRRSAWKSGICFLTARSGVLLGPIII